MSRGFYRAPMAVGLLAALLLALACGPAAAPSQAPRGTGQVGGTEVAGTRIPQGVPDHPYPAVIAPDEKEKDVARYKTGGTFNYTSLDPPHLDVSLSASCTAYNVSDMVYNKLVRAKLGPFGDQFGVELEGDLAKSWEVSADGKTYTFKLHEGVKFQNLPPVNGRELTAEDVVFSYKDYAASGVQTSYYEMVDRIEAPDKYTVRITLRQPFADFLPGLAEMSFIRPKELKDEDGNFRKRAIGTGPFIMREWTPKQGVKYDKNPSYFEMNSAGQRMPYLDKANMFVIPDAATARAAYRAGQVEVVDTRTVADTEDVLRSTPDTIVQSNGQTMVRGNVNGLQMRLDKAPFNDVRVRRALSMGVDRKAFNETLYEGRGIMAVGMAWIFFTRTYPKLEDYGPWFQHNPQRAKDLLAEAGFPQGLTINLVDWYLRDQGIEIIQDHLRSIGVTLRRREVDNPTHVVLLNEKKFEEMTGTIWGNPNYAIDGSIYPWWHSKGSKNFDGLNDPAMDKLLEAQRAEMDPAKRQKILQEVWDRANDQVYQIWWQKPRQNYGWRSYVKNYRTHATIGNSGCYTTGNLIRMLWLDK
ncbi:MAG: ABC transporter substrate-binding protein [Chloroflexi bacterium]|nr:ABC transporter substrate-binding protein [Chloroflexota bacterium]